MKEKMILFCKRRIIGNVCKPRLFYLFNCRNTSLGGNLLTCCNAKIDCNRTSVVIGIDSAVFRLSDTIRNFIDRKGFVRIFSLIQISILFNRRFKRSDTGSAVLYIVNLVVLHRDKNRARCFFKPVGIRTDRLFAVLFFDAFVEDGFCRRKDGSRYRRL